MSIAAKQRLYDQPVAARSFSPKCIQPLANAILDIGSITPGILRPEEYHNTLGRCQHQESHSQPRRSSIAKADTNSTTSDEHELRSATTLVASPVPQTLFDKYQTQFADRTSISSSSSYSSRASEEEDPVSTNRLIRYYAGSSSDPGEDIIIRRSSQFSNDNNPWFADHNILDSCQPLSAHLVEKPRQGSLPPPHQHSNQKASSTLPEYYSPDRKAISKDEDNQHGRWGNNSFEKNIYILRLCKAFLLFGASSHRLEEYMHMTAATLGITAEFQYIPHCMLIVLSNPLWVQNEVHLLKESTSVDLGKLEDVYQVYQSVADHGKDLHRSIKKLDKIICQGKRYNNLLLILLHGLAAICAGTFAFSARPIDFGSIYVLGCLLAILQLLVLRTPIRSSHILEVLTSIIIAFAARGLGSIQTGIDHNLFCFSGITQGVVALILPGHIILAATHEIQNRQVLSGSVKMVYAVIYTLFLGFGILIGATLYGFVDTDAVNATHCQLPWYWDTLNERWRAMYAQFIWVPIFALSISIMHQAKRRHLPAMVIIATCGHQAFYWSLSRFAQNLQFSGMIAAFASGMLANLYACYANCLAATILLPAVLVQIPNALAASGSLVAGIDTADAIVRNRTYNLANGMTKGVQGVLQTRDFTAEGPSGSTGLIVTSAFGMVQATIGITVGLFLSALVVYPFIKRKTGSLAF